MTISERHDRDHRAYVYLQLPQSMEVVTAGYYELGFSNGIATGSFVYSPAYLDRDDAVPLEPYELPLSPRRATPRPTPGAAASSNATRAGRT
jgi:hypothetical protein